MRDIDSDYKAALLEEYESLKRGGKNDRASAVAEFLKSKYEIDLEPEEQATPEWQPETTKLPEPTENTAEPKPRTRRRTTKG